MKKIIKLSLVFAAAALLLSACKSHEKCPAYGQMSKPSHSAHSVG